jgi:hypothetical protein
MERNVCPVCGQPDWNWRYALGQFTLYSIVLFVCLLCWLGIFAVALALWSMV